MPQHCPDNLQFFTIVGVGRSGTSLLMTALDSHPMLALPPETQFVWRHIARWPKATLAQTRTRVATETNFARLHFDLDEFFAPFESGGEAFSNARAYRRIFELWAHRTGTARIGDKSPKNIEYLPLIQRIFPAAKVIHIIRDPRDVFLSRTKAKWSAGRSRLAQALAYRAQFDMARRIGPRLFGERYLEVHYEEILSNPQAELGRICSLLGVPFDAKMLDREKSARTHVFREEIEWKQTVLGPLLTENRDKWRKELSPEDVAFIEDSCITSFCDGRYAPAKRGQPGHGGIRGAWARAQMYMCGTAYRAWIAHRNRRAVRRMAVGTAPSLVRRAA
jgi:hypothetical protein